MPAEVRTSPRGVTSSVDTQQPDVDAAARFYAEAGGTVLAEPGNAGPAGRFSTIADPLGAVLHLWQARRRLGAKALNEPGAWNFSDLHTPDPAAAATFCSSALGWLVEDQGWATSIRAPGYGDHLEATDDPDIRSRQAHAPEGFADVIGGTTQTVGDERPHWHATFTVADRDATVATAERLCVEVLATSDDAWTRRAVIRDPRGAVFTASQLAPEEWG